MEGAIVEATKKLYGFRRPLPPSLALRRLSPEFKQKPPRLATTLGRFLYVGTDRKRHFTHPILTCVFFGSSRSNNDPLPDFCEKGKVENDKWGGGG